MGTNYDSLACDSFPYLFFSEPISQNKISQNYLIDKVIIVS